jgi:hypothetical protein
MRTKYKGENEIVFIPSYQEEIEKLKKILVEQEKTDEKFSFKLSEVVLFGELSTMTKEQCYALLDTTPPYRYKGVNYGRKDPVSHLSYVKGCYNVKYGIFIQRKRTKRELEFIEYGDYRNTKLHQDS